MIGGSGERKTLRLVSQYADACNIFGGPDEVAHKVEVLRRHCDAIERDPDAICEAIGEGRVRVESRPITWALAARVMLALAFAGSPQNGLDEHGAVQAFRPAHPADLKVLTTSD